MKRVDSRVDRQGKRKQGKKNTDDFGELSSHQGMEASTLVSSRKGIRF
jgi:hypothetical protein